MNLYTVHVIDSVLPRRSANAKVLVGHYVSMADSAVEAARNVAREQTVHPTDLISVRPYDGLTMSIGSRVYFPSQVPHGDEEFLGSDFPAQDE